MRCRRCGGALVEVHETLPYVGPGEYAVELREVQSLRCSACRAGQLHVPELHALDLLIRVLSREDPRRTPQLVFRDGRWRVTAWSVHRDAVKGQAT